MRSFLLVSPIAALLSILVIHAATAAAVGEAPMRRYRMSGTPVSRNLSEAEIYARELTRRSPTRRSTAQRRQTSELPITNNAITVGATNQNTGSIVGSLDLSSAGVVLGVSSTPMSSDYSPSWSTMTGRRVTLNDAAASDYPNLGLIQYASTSGLFLGSGLSNGVRVGPVANPGTAAGSGPSYINNYVTQTNTLGVETDVWTINYSSGAMTATWVNPDGSTPGVSIISDGTTIIVTGDVAAFSAAHTESTWFPITLVYTN